MLKEHIVSKTEIAIKVISRLEMVGAMQMFVYVPQIWKNPHNWRRNCGGVVRRDIGTKSNVVYSTSKKDLQDVLISSWACAEQIQVGKK